MLHSTACLAPDSALKHADILYFTVTTFTTAGSGDIHPSSHACRLLVAGQTLKWYPRDKQDQYSREQSNYWL